MGWESFGVAGFDLWPLLQGQTRIAKLKSTYNSLIMSNPLGDRHIIFAFSGVRHPSVMLGFRSFKGKVFILSLPNLVWVFIGLIACMGLLLVKIAL